MEILTELAKRGGLYVAVADKSADASRRDEYLALAAECFHVAARRAEALIGSDVLTDESWKSLGGKAD